ncbi:MAG: RNA degradosome polyphosphate kinase, partial [Acidobacteriota bacterium]|nr:RNA degradosome polyphosphate kinase [Acidobacteriota bacterium]
MGPAHGRRRPHDRADRRSRRGRRGADRLPADRRVPRVHRRVAPRTALRSRTEPPPTRAQAGKKRAVQVADRLINRELSFLDYDARVLDVATDASLPLLERVRFCAIFSAMLDEFFMTRVAGLTGQAAAGVTVRSPDGRTPQQTISDSRARALELYEEQARIWSQSLCPALAAEGIVLSGVEELSETELHRLEQRYQEEVYPVLTPLAVGPGQPFPYISALSVSLAVFVRDPETGEER